jgi:hypothetical protein
VHAAVVEKSVTVSDAVAQAGCGAEGRGRRLINHGMLREYVKRRARLFCLSPSLVGDPVRGEIDALLNGEKEIKTKRGRGSAHRR